MKRSQKVAIFCFTLAIIFWIIIAIGDAKYGYPIISEEELAKPVDPYKVQHGMERMIDLGFTAENCQIVFEQPKKFDTLIPICEHFFKDLGTLLDKLYQKYPDM